MRILTFQHLDIEHPGRLGSTLRDHGYRLDIRRIDRGDGFPPDLDDVHALLVMGGPQNVDEDLPWMDREAELIRAAHERELPVIGICLGSQLVAHALGGTVAPMTRPEWGFHDVSLTDAGQTETMLAGVAWRHPQFHCHGQEVVELPPGAVHLASSAMCRHQAFKVGLRTFGFQFHFECDRQMVSQFCAHFKDSIAAAGTSAAQIEAQADDVFDDYARIGGRISVNLASYAFPFDRLLAV